MSPYPAQVDRERIVEAARQMLEAEGYDTLTLAKLAEALHIKAPSLYKHYANKAEVMRAVISATIRSLAKALQQAIDTQREPLARMVGMGSAYRAFALQNPVCYSLAYGQFVQGLQPDPAELEALAIPFQSAMAALSGGAKSLAALRGAWALVHGYAILEINHQFQRGAVTDADFELALRAYLSGWLAPMPPASDDSVPGGQTTAHGQS